MSESHQTLTPKKILILEDDLALASQIRVALEQEGFQVFLVRDADAAIEVLENDDMQLVIADMMIRKSDGTYDPKGGLTVLTHVNLNMALKPPVVTITGAAPETALVLISNSMGAAMSFSKPIKMPEFIESVNQIMKARS